MGARDIDDQSAVAAFAAGPGRTGPLPYSVRSAPLIGREPELTALIGLLSDSSVRLVTITGRSGVGKTRLALELAWTVDSTRPGSVCVVSLAAVPGPDFVLAAVAAQLDIALLPGLTAADAVTGWLRREAQVLLLDNFEHLLEAAPVLTDLLDACDGLQVVVTSQAPLRLGAERIVRLAPLPLPDEQSAELAVLAVQPAVALYCDRARAADDSFRLRAGNASAVAALCRELEGLPLAIELAAARAVAMPAADIVSRLTSGRLDVLRSARPGSPARHRDLRSAIGWTYGLLSGDERQLLARLSVAGGAFAIEDAEALDDGAAADVIDALSALVDFHLITPRAADDLARFELPPSVREFGAEELAATGETDQVQDIWLTWLAGRSRSAAAGLMSADPDAWWRWLRDAEDCLASAVQVALDSSRPELAAELLSGLLPYWNALGFHPAHHKLLDRAIGMAAQAELRSPALAEALLWSGLAGARVLTGGDQGKYSGRLRQGEELARALADQQLILLALHHRLLAAPMTGEFAQVGPMLREGTELARQLDIPGWIARFELTVARMAAMTGDQQRALATGLAALASARRGGDTRAELETVTMLQLMAPQHPAAAAALPAPDRLVAMSRSIHQTLLEAALLPLFARQAAAAGDLSAAANWCADALAVAGFGPSSYLAGFALVVAMEVIAARRDFAFAARIHGRLAGVLPLINAAIGGMIEASHEQVIASLREMLGARSFEEAVTAGQRVPWEQLVTEVRDYFGALQLARTPSTAPGDDPVAELLTARQLDVLRLLSGGLTNKEIADRLGLTPKTVMHHTVAVYQRLGLRGRSEAVAWAVRAGVTTP